MRYKILGDSSIPAIGLGLIAGQILDTDVHDVPISELRRLEAQGVLEKIKTEGKPEKKRNASPEGN